jgi:aromatic ring-opening dioxygenase LigB subunit
MGILTADRCTGDMLKWGDRMPPHTFENDTELAALIQNEAHASGIPVRPFRGKGYALDHGSMVPLHFLMQGLKNTPIIMAASAGTL